MPRGIYDRSKMKKKAAKAESAAPEAPKAKRKYTRRVVAEAKQLVGMAKPVHAPYGGDTLFLLRELTQLKSMGVGVQLESLIKKVTIKLEQEWDETNRPVEVAPKTVKTNGKSALKEVEKEEPKQTALPAPVPFIPQPATPA